MGAYRSFIRAVVIIRAHHEVRGKLAEFNHSARAAAPHVAAEIRRRGGRDRTTGPDAPQPAIVRLRGDRTVEKVVVAVPKSVIGSDEMLRFHLFRQLSP